MASIIFITLFNKVDFISATPRTSKNVKLADGQLKLMQVMTADIEVQLLHKTVCVEFIIFPEACDNESLLGINFLTKANLSFDFGRSVWCFSENPNIQYELTFEPATKTLHTASNDTVDEDVMLSQLLDVYSDVFNGSGPATDYAEHQIDTGEHRPIFVPPYHVTPAKKEIMRQEIEKMLAEGIIEECESPWGSPALLVPKKQHEPLTKLTRKNRQPLALARRKKLLHDRA